MKTEKNSLSLWKIALGAIFLFNPTINIVDPIPDFIGYLFIISGLGALAYLNDSCMTARKSFLYLTVLSVGKLLVSLLLPFIMDDTMGVLFSFSFAVAEGVFFISAFYNLFEGITSLGMRYGNEEVFFVPLKRSRLARINALEKRLGTAPEAKKAELERKIKRLSRKKRVASLRNFTVFAFLVRAAGSVIPTLPSLSMENVTEFYTDTISWKNYVAPLYLFCWIVGFAVCIPWLIRFRRYIKGVMAQRELCDNICSRYENEVLCDPRCLMADRMKAVFILCIVASALTFYMPVDGINIFPAFICATLTIAAFAMMIGLERNLCIAGIIYSALWGASSLIGTYLQADYARDYVRSTHDELYKAAAYGVERAVEMFDNMQIFAWIEGGLFLITFLLLSITLSRAIDRSCAMIPKRADGKDESTKALKRCLVPAWWLGLAVCAANCALLTVMKYFTEAWIIYSAICVVFFVLVLRAYYRLDETVYERLRRKF